MVEILDVKACTVTGLRTDEDEAFTVGQKAGGHVIDRIMRYLASFPRTGGHNGQLARDRWGRNQYPLVVIGNGESHAFGDRQRRRAVGAAEYDGRHIRFDMAFIKKENILAIRREAHDD